MEAYEIIAVTLSVYLIVVYGVNRYKKKANAMKHLKANDFVLEFN